MPSPATFVSDQELCAAVEQLPPVGPVMQRLLEVLSDLDSDVEDVARLVRVDTALSAQVLRLANSAYFGLVERVASVEEAVQHIGMTQVQRLVSLLGGRRLFDRPLDRYLISAPLLWHHTLTVAVASELVAERIGGDDGIAYLGGILHNIGIVALDSVAATRGLSPRDPEVPLLDWERENFGVDNAAAAARVLRHWKFPEVVCAGVASRYAPPVQSTAKDPSSVLYLACCLAERTIAGLAPESGLFRLNPEALDAVGLDMDGIESLDRELQHRMARMRTLLRLV